MYTTKSKNKPKKAVLAIFSNLRAVARKFEYIAKMAVFKAILGLYINLRAAARKFRHIYHIGMLTLHMGCDIPEKVKKLPQKGHFGYILKFTSRGS